MIRQQVTAPRWVWLTWAVALVVLLVSMSAGLLVDATWPDRVAKVLWLPVMITAPLVVGWGPVSRRSGSGGA